MREDRAHDPLKHLLHFLHEESAAAEAEILRTTR
jgi:hypothetical protein